MDPKLQASALYSKIKLSVHILSMSTIYDLISRDATSYLWHEGEAGLSAHEFTTCIVTHLEAHLSYDVYIIWSDGCGVLNRNVILRNALLRYVTEKQRTVT